MPTLLSIATSLPQNSYSVQDVLSVGDEWLGQDSSKKELFKRFVTSSKTETRNFIVPRSDILSIGGLRQRAALFEEFAAPLGSDALDKALSIGGLNRRELQNLIFTSCSCPAIPSVDALIIDTLELDRCINRLPIFQHGCAGGVVGLRLAAELSKVQGYVALTSVELCSLVFQKQNPTPAQLVGAAIFADGAASAIVSPDERNGLVIRGSQSYLIPNTRHLMGYDILDDGFHLKLDRALPEKLIEVTPTALRSFLSRYGIDREQVSYWLFHPGGSKILDFFETNLELRPEQAPWSRQVLNTIGNLSSASVLFVLQKFLESKVCRDGDKVVMVGVGPGLTLEMILFEWKER